MNLYRALQALTHNTRPVYLAGLEREIRVIAAVCSVSVNTVTVPKSHDVTPLPRIHDVTAACPQTMTLNPCPEIMTLQPAPKS